jgi:hypothetical protein
MARAERRAALPARPLHKIILLSIDTLRADFLDVGSAAPTPHLIPAADSVCSHGLPHPDAARLLPMMTGVGHRTP